jgi:hypothetical protein
MFTAVCQQFNCMGKPLLFFVANWFFETKYLADTLAKKGEGLASCLVHGLLSDLFNKHWLGTYLVIHIE